MNGTVADVPISQAYNHGAMRGTAGNPFQILYTFGTNGLFSMVGTGEKDPWDFVDVGETLVLVGGHVRMPEEGPLAEQWLCSGAGSTVTEVSDGLFLHLVNVELLGSCADAAPVDGQLEVCSASDCTEYVSGSIEGVVVKAERLGSSSIGSYLDVGIRPGFAQVRADFDASVFDASTGNVVGGYVAMDATGSHRGAVYCIGGGTYAYHADGSDGWRATLTSFSKIAECASPQSEDVMDVCIPVPF
jgi:hypothetical protein